MNLPTLSKQNKTKELEEKKRRISPRFGRRRKAASLSAAPSLSLSVHALRSRSGSCSTSRFETNHQLFNDDDEDDAVCNCSSSGVGVGRRSSSSSLFDSARLSPRIAPVAAPIGEALECFRRLRACTETESARRGCKRLDEQQIAVVNNVVAVAVVVGVGVGVLAPSLFDFALFDLFDCCLLRGQRRPDLLLDRSARSGAAPP